MLNGCQFATSSPSSWARVASWSLDRGATDVAVSLDPETLEIDVSIPVPSFPNTVGFEPALDTTSHAVRCRATTATRSRASTWTDRFISVEAAEDRGAPLSAWAYLSIE